ncbi:MAG: hypothetical protein RIB98_07560 [Acidimicrobiales bacterium]
MPGADIDVDEGADTETQSGDDEAAWAATLRGPAQLGYSRALAEASVSVNDAPTGFTAGSPNPAADYREPDVACTPDDDREENGEVTRLRNDTEAVGVDYRLTWTDSSEAAAAALAAWNDTPASCALTTYASGYERALVGESATFEGAGETAVITTTYTASLNDRLDSVNLTYVAQVDSFLLEMVYWSFVPEPDRAAADELFQLQIDEFLRVYDHAS